MLELRPLPLPCKEPSLPLLLLATVLVVSKYPFQKPSLVFAVSYFV